MTPTYKVEISGQFVGLPCVGGADLMVNGQQIRLPDALLRLVPPEPPNNSAVKVGRQIYRRDDAAAEDDGYHWFSAGVRTPCSWVDLTDRGTPVLLVPAPEPVTLPWKNVDNDGDRLTIQRGENPHLIEVKASDGHGNLVIVYAPRDELLRAVWTAAADEADRRTA